MKRSVLVAYQLLTGLSDTSTGLLLIVSPALTLTLMKLQTAPETLPLLSFVGAFVLSVGLACFYGAWLARKAMPAQPSAEARIEVVWLLTATTRALVALVVGVKIAAGALEPGWISVVVTDAIFASIQFVGLARGWVRNVRL